MRYRCLKLTAVLFLVLGLTGLQAQESLNTTGGDASGSGGSVSYSVGQLVYMTNTETSGSAAQGVQQPYEISVVTAVEQAIGINLSITAYPNPAIDNLTLSIKEFEILNLGYRLYNIQGQLLKSEIITEKQTTIYVGDLSPAVYFLRVVQDRNEVKVFKINKQ